MAAPPVTERDFQSAVVAYLQMHGWLVFHDHDSRRNAAGFPDTVAVHPTRRKLLLVELKAQKGRHRPEQLAWLKALDDVETIYTGTWKPGDWTEIERIAR